MCNIITAIMLLLQNTIITCSHCSPGEAQSAPSWSPTGTLSDRGNDLKMLILFCQERTIDHTQSNVVTTQTKFMWPYGRHLNLKVLQTKEKYTSSPSAGIFTQTVDFEFGKYRICLFCTDELILETVILQCFMLQSKSHNKKCQI